MGYVSDLLAGLATTANAAGLGVYPYTAGATVPDGSAAVFLKDMPDQPDRCVALAAYNPVDSPDQPTGSISVQMRFRGLAADVRDVDDLADAWFQFFQGLIYLPCGSCEVQQILRKSSLPGGRDGSRRWERTDNWDCDLWLPATAHRT